MRRRQFLLTGLASVLAMPAAAQEQKAEADLGLEPVIWAESMPLAHPPPIARRETGVLPDALCGGGRGWGVARAEEIIECAAALLSRRMARPPP